MAVNHHTINQHVCYKIIGEHSTCSKLLRTCTYATIYVFIFTPYIFLFFMLREYVYCHVIHAAMLTCVPTYVPTPIIDCCCCQSTCLELLRTPTCLFLHHMSSFFFTADALIVMSSMLQC